MDAAIAKGAEVYYLEYDWGSDAVEPVRDFDVGMCFKGQSWLRGT